MFKDNKCPGHGITDIVFYTREDKGTHVLLIANISVLCTIVQ